MIIFNLYFCFVKLANLSETAGSRKKCENLCDDFFYTDFNFNFIAMH